MTDSKNIKAFIFDLDGTLIDTEKIYSRVWPEAIAKTGYKMTREMYLYQRSLGRPFSTEWFASQFGEDFDLLKARSIRKGLFEAYVAEHGIQLKKGAVELLTYLRSKGIITAIATATDMERATEYVERVGLTSYIDRIISATQVKEGKPSPMVYAYACECLGLTVDECIAVEDAPNGIKSAAGAGLRVIMVPDLTEPDEELRRLIFARVDSLDDIIPMI